jgi:hypothetical protein
VGVSESEVAVVAQQPASHPRGVIVIRIERPAASGGAAARCAATALFRVLRSVLLAGESGVSSALRVVLLPSARGAVGAARDRGLAARWTEPRAAPVHVARRFYSAVRAAAPIADRRSRPRGTAAMAEPRGAVCLSVRASSSIASGALALAGELFGPTATEALRRVPISPSLLLRAGLGLARCTHLPAGHGRALSAVGARGHVRTVARDVSGFNPPRKGEIVTAWIGGD